MEKKKSFDMSSDEFKKMGYELIEWTANYLSNLESLPVLPNVKPGDIKSKLPKEAPQNPEGSDKFMNDLNEIILPGVTHWQHPNFMAYFNSTGSMPGILGEIVAAAFSTNGMVWKSNPASTELEETVLNWFRDLVGLPEEYFGIVYDSASVSTMHGIAAARENAGLNIRKHGMCGIPKLILYCTEHAHSSIDKGALTLGIGLDGIHKIKADENFEMIPSELANAIIEDRKKGYVPFCVAATVGTTSSTAVDPVDAIADICEREKIWFHLDCAHAGVMALLPEMRKHFKGFDRADSIVFNPHKWLFVPMDFSILYTRKPQVLKEAFSLVPEYLKTSADDQVINYMDYGIQLGRRFRSIKFWFVLRYFGADGLRERLREHVRLGQLFAKWVDEDSDFERLAPTNFSTVSFRAHPKNIFDEASLNNLNEKLLENINSTGKVFMSHTKLNGKFTLRTVISSLRVEEKHVRLAWDVIRESLKQTLDEQKQSN
jgi:aromatic-L-amino-acid/L-tryptophan decarboxylase